MSYQGRQRRCRSTPRTGPKDQLAESIANTRAMDDRAMKAAKDTARKGSGGAHK